MIYQRICILLASNSKLALFGGTGVYAATKAFNDNIVRTCALENSKYGITANSLQLGYFNAGLTYKVPQDILTKVINKIPMGRLGNGEDLITAIRFIFNSPYFTGVNLQLSGGGYNSLLKIFI